MARRSSLRASDADRDRVAERLTQAAAEGRLLVHELEDRLATALRARTYGELDAVVADLPGTPTRTQSRGVRSLYFARSHPAGAVLALATIAVVMCVVAAVVVTAFFAFGGIWLILALVFLARRGHGSSGGYWRSDRYGRGPSRGGWT